MDPFKEIVVLLIMIYLHIFDDFVLQNALARMKQKDYWADAVKEKPFYKYDYVIALLAHATSWTTTVSIPILISLLIRSVNPLVKVSFLCVYFINIVIHAHIDNRKANAKDINLIIDQSMHIIQVVSLWLIFCGIWN